MNSDRFQEAKRIYNSALEREPEQRQTYLEEACAGDASLRKEVESLLACQPDAKEFFKSPAIQEGAQALAGGKVGTGSPVPDFGDRGACPTFPDLTGRKLLHYALTEKIGQGGMGTVYKARDLHLDRSVAIKILPAHAMADAERKRRFVQEAKAASALDHPNVVQIHDISSDAGVDFIAMEYVSGKTLDQRIGRKGLPVSEVLKCGVQVADALAAAHAAGIVHRDLKPANVMVTEKGLVKVLDFGLAKLIQPAQNDITGDLSGVRTLTEKGRILGTVAYMSPEQAEGKEVDARSDIFTLGSMLYEMVTGRRAFQGDSNLSTLWAILKQEPSPFGAGIPRDLEKIITRCLRKDPAHRFQHMDDVRVALQEVKEETDSGKAETVPPLRARRQWLVWIAILLGAMVVTSLMVWYFRPSPEPAVEAKALTTSLGTEFAPCLSPDGNYVAFSWNGEKEDNHDIYVSLIGPGKPLRLTTDPARDSSPAWSPDGRSIAFLRSLPEGKAVVILVPALGGTERKLAEVYDPSRVIDTMIVGPHLAWFPDGIHLIIMDRSLPSEPVALFLINTERGEKRRLTSPPGSAFGDRGPALSPDGRTVAFSRLITGGPEGLFLLRLKADLSPLEEPRRLTPDDWMAGSPAWLKDTEIVFRSARYGREGLWRISTSGSKPPVRLALGAETAFWPSISIPRHRLVYANAQADLNLWRLEVPESRPVGPVVYSTQFEYNAQYSPDGSRIAFASNRSGSYEIWTCGGDGSNPVQLTSMAAPSTGTPRWSPDGSRIAFDSNREGQPEVYVVAAEGGIPKHLTNNPAADSVPSWSRDGNWIYFRSNRSGENQVWKVRASGGEAVQVTHNGGFVAFESADGRWLFYTKADPGPLWRTPVEGGEEEQILPSVMARAFAVTAEGIYAMSACGVNCCLQYYNFRTQKSATIHTMRRTPGLGLTVSADGRSILYSQWDIYGSDLMLVENFR